MQLLIGIAMVVLGLGITLDFFQIEQKEEIRDLTKELSITKSQSDSWQSRFYDCENSKVENPIVYASLKEEKPEPKLEVVESMDNVFVIKKAGTYLLRDSGNLTRVPDSDEVVEYE